MPIPPKAPAGLREHCSSNTPTCVWLVLFRTIMQAPINRLIYSTTSSLITVDRCNSLEEVRAGYCLRYSEHTTCSIVTSTSQRVHHHASQSRRQLTFVRDNTYDDSRPTRCIYPLVTTAMLQHQAVKMPYGRYYPNTSRAYICRLSPVKKTPFATTLR